MVSWTSRSKNASLPHSGLHEIQPLLDLLILQILNWTNQAHFFVHISDKPSSDSVSHKLNGSNYHSWARSMCWALRRKLKPKFVDVIVTPISDTFDHLCHSSFLLITMFSFPLACRVILFSNLAMLFLVLSNLANLFLWLVIWFEQFVSRNPDPALCWSSNTAAMNTTMTSSESSWTILASSSPLSRSFSFPLLYQ